MKSRRCGLRSIRNESGLGEPRLLRAAMQHRFISHVAIDEFYRVIRPWREGDIADQRAAGKFAFDMRRDAGAIVLLVQNHADPDIRQDLLRGDGDLGGGLIAAVALAMASFR
jgi:hypothetical protein